MHFVNLINTRNESWKKHKSPRKQVVVGAPNIKYQSNLPAFAFWKKKLSMEKESSLSLSPKVVFHPIILNEMLSSATVLVSDTKYSQRMIAGKTFWRRKNIFFLTTKFPRNCYMRPCPTEGRDRRIRMPMHKKTDATNKTVRTALQRF